MPVLTNQRYELFAQALARGETADEAYQTAGYEPNRGNASTLKAKQIIEDRVTELLSRAAEKTATTIFDIARQLDADRSFAISVNSASAAVSATMGKAKVLGLIVDKTDATVTLDNRTELDAERFASGIARIATRSRPAQGNKRTVN